MQEKENGKMPQRWRNLFPPLDQPFSTQCPSPLKLPTILVLDPQLSLGDPFCLDRRSAGTSRKTPSCILQHPIKEQLGALGSGRQRDSVSVSRVFSGGQIHRVVFHPSESHPATHTDAHTLTHTHPHPWSLRKQSSMKKHLLQDEKVLFLP